MEAVYITGMGVISPIGASLDTFWHHLVKGKSGVGRLATPEISDAEEMIGAQVSDQDLESVVSRKERRRMSRASQLALAAAREAVEQAGLDSVDQHTKQQIAVIIGSSIGGFAASDPVFKEYYTEGKQSSLVIPISMNSGPSANVSIRYGFGGHHMTVDAACATAAHSIGALYNLIRFGQVDIGITGGADTPFARAVMQAWYNLRVVTSRTDDPARACRPFSADRDGMVLGEGAGILVLESERSVRRRNARPLARLVGYGASSDGHHITRPSTEGPAQAMRRALEDASMRPDGVDYINAHATGTPWNDRVETAAIKTVFGEHAYHIPVVGIKPSLGHSIGASGALEIIACVQTIRTKILPPTLNYTSFDPDCDLDYVTEGSRTAAIHTAMSNSFAFGGSNAALIVTQAEET